ncbi:prolipoprotein diacylglyceryl transferase [Clostridium perfringens]|uniref:prolipoprotein diacylglyceryl transferase n=1 Tax=Clostridium perfringens TaxID=1502 RepID=UPI000DF0E995|nr:prolipoprotein diacylglyceryl transferase [Clostridium perfringens]STB44291.1 prolipoprotein diacylglyceryl transferase [Clostridium perfringens]
MRIVLGEIFGLKIYSYGFMIGLGIICATLLFLKRGTQRGYNEDKLFNATILTVISGILGGKILYIITEWKTVMQDPSLIFRDFGNGFVIYGAIIGGALGIALCSLKNKWNVLELADLVVPGLALAQGFGRIGCLLAGCCYGAETTSSIGIIFPADSLAPAGIPLYPTQIFSSIFDFALGLFLLWYGNKNKEKGKTMSMYMIIYSIGRFFLEFLRNDPRGSVGLLSTSQFISIFILIGGILLYNINKLKGRKETSEK